MHFDHHSFSRSALQSNVCDFCRSKLPLLPPGLDVLQSQHQHNLNLQYIDGLCSAALYRWPFNQWIYALKFGNKPQVAQTLSYFLAKQIEQQDWRVDLISAVPLSRLRELYRGYNQANLLVEALSLYIHPKSDLAKYAHRYNGLVRHRHTKAQAKLTQQQRRENVDNVFKCQTPLINKNVLLIDDVVTTASTVNQAARALKNAGATKVYAGCTALKVLD